MDNIVLSLGSGTLIFRARLFLVFRHCPDFNCELIPVSREDGDRDPHGHPGLVERGPEFLEYGDPAVLRQVEERRFRRVRRPHGNQVAIPDLLQAQGFQQVLTAPPSMSSASLSRLAPRSARSLG